MKSKAFGRVTTRVLDAGLYDEGLAKVAVVNLQVDNSDLCKKPGKRFARDPITTG